MVQPDDLFTPGPAKDAKAPIMVAHLDGALDAGSAGALAVEQLLKTLNVQRVATFDTDQLIDYRSHRPMMQVEDWVTKDVTEPEIALDLIHDDQGQPILLLHGNEPDAKWKTFTQALRMVADSAGVEAVFSLHGMPAAVPHTRPSTVHVQSTDEQLIPDQPMMAGLAQFPAPYTSYLQYQLAKSGRTGVTLLATVPYYMAGSTFPRASSALIRRLSEMADLSLPVGDLERGADEEVGEVNKVLEHNRDLQNTVNALELHFDSITLGPADAAEMGDDSTGGLPIVSEMPDWDAAMNFDLPDGSFPEAEQIGEEDDASLADAIGDAIEGYLRTRSKQKRRREFTTGQPTIADQPHVPRHRAPLPGEDTDLPDSDSSQS